MDIPAQAPLGHWLRLLWGSAPALHLNSPAPFIAGGAIHLPACAHWLQHRAAAAHAAAHLVFSPRSFDSGGLSPVTRALLALLEDARAEALAARELPGLARLWRPLHVATPADGNTFEALMQRLARALADPGYDDPHPWVRKGRALFFLDARAEHLALRTPVELRRAATRLGHDIGQMRLPFSSRTYRPAPAYRDDHRWMWAADDLAAATPPAPLAADSPLHDESPPVEADSLVQHPEWDRLINRLRQNWCTVIEEQAAATAAASATTASTPQGIDGATLALSRRLRGPLRALSRPLAARRRSIDGECFDIEALLQWRLAQRLRLPTDPRVYRGRPPSAPRAVVWLLVDRSASTAEAHGRAGHSALHMAVRAAAALALALQAAGVPCAVAGFSSNGRHAVRLLTVKRLREPVDGAVLARLQTLRPGGSTRLGAALRHASARLADETHGARWVLLLSDGQPHDVDVHDPAYLIADARHAVRQAGRSGVRMACLSLAGAATGVAAGDALRIFGRRGVQRLDELGALPRSLLRLVA